jgi:hypothetical protein
MRRHVREMRIGTIRISDDGGTTPSLEFYPNATYRARVGQTGPSRMSRLVSDMMTSKLVTCGPSDTTDSVLAKWRRAFATCR